MIYKIIASYFFFCLLIAIFFSLAGVGGDNEFGTYFQTFISQVNSEYAKMQWDIPKIPDIPTEWLIQKINLDENWVVSVLLIRFIGIFIFLTNMLIRVLNVVVYIFNFILHLAQYIYVLITCLYGMRMKIVQDTDVSSIPLEIFKGLLKNPIVAFWGGGFQSPLNL